MISLSLSFLSNPENTILKNTAREHYENVFILGIKRNKPSETFHEEHTLIFQLIVCNNLHYFRKYFFIKREINNDRA